MRHVSIEQRWLFIFTAALVIMGGLGWANIRFARSNPGGNDFLVHYQGARALLLEGISPYSDLVADRIQDEVYGRPARPGEHELRVAYPLYSVGLFAPFALISNYPAARALWMTFLEICLLAAALINFQVLGWKPGPGLAGVVLLFSLSWYHGARGVINGNAVIVLALLVSLCLWALKEGREYAAGILMALTTIKPHLVALWILLILLWTLSRGNWRSLIAFLLTMGLMIGVGMLVVPDWVLQNLREVIRFPSYNPVLTLGGALASWLPGIGHMIKWGLGLGLGLLLAVEWWQVRGKGFRHFCWTACLTLVITQMMGIPTDPGNFILFFPALMVIFATWDQRWRKFGSYAVLAAAALLGVGLWFLFILTLERTYQPVQSPVMFLPLPAFTMLGMYWVRWWMVKPILAAMEESSY